MMLKQVSEHMKPLPLSGNLAIALAVKQSDPDVIPVYPISPSTTVAEALAKYVAEDELQSEFLTVESEHSAISAAIGASATGGRTFTVTSSQGLLLMHEILFMASGLRTPVVMAVANRAVSAPINIWNDHSDVMAQRDVGWIQFFVETVQEAYDRTLQAFRIAEDPDVRLPVMVNYDGVKLSHTYAPVNTLEDSEVEAFSPRVPPQFKLDPNHPVSMGALASPDYYYEAKYQASRALADSPAVIRRVEMEFEDLTGRSYSGVDLFMDDDAKLLLIASGSICGTFKTQIRKLRGQGVKAGLVGLKRFRPFPRLSILSAIENAEAIGVVDRALTPGAISGPLFTEISSLLYTVGLKIPIANFIVGLGGRDTTLDDATEIFSEIERVSAEGQPLNPTKYIGLRGET